MQMVNNQKRTRNRPSWKQLLLGGIVGGGVGIAGAIAGVALYIVETLIKPKTLTNFIEQYTFSPYELNLPAEEVTFPPLYGEHTVSGWFVPCPGATSTIILCPGYRGRRSDVLGTCVNLWKAGHNILAFEYYGHGAVVGKPITLGYREINDFLGAVAYAKQRAPQTRLGAVGYSMGAAIVIMAAARTPEIEAVVADSPFATHKSPIEYAVHRTLHLPFILFEWMTDVMLWWRAGYRFNQVEPLRDIGRISPRPIMIIHGLKDSIVDPRDAPLLYKAAGNPKELWLLPEADHCGAYFEDRVVYVEKLTAFFDQHLKQAHPPISLQERKDDTGPQKSHESYTEAG
ncbi:alpha/beta hydrolase [Ktedonospora formicarum]|uniref:Alpha/beta hydrolase n=1 Tax=Ktedonospora formicarum TaxID=2778364 RepID=A0A8J3I1J7_9CHLR|nr:alpha/beta hydrolase [Ktedonospora formicarum]GHO45090.1 alpha/beta hydrolase [Ktedonospora formicarum]